MIKRLAILACLFATEAHALRQNITFRGNGSWTNLSANRIELTQITMTMSCGCQATSSFYVVNGNSTSLVQSKSGNPLNVATWPQGTNSPTAFYLYTGDRILFRNSVTNQATGLFNGNESGGAVNNIPYVQIVGAYGISTNIQGSTGVTYVILYPASLPPSGSATGTTSDITGTYPTNLQIVAGAVGLPELTSGTTITLARSENLWTNALKQSSGGTIYGPVTNNESITIAGEDANSQIIIDVATFYPSIMFKEGDNAKTAEITLGDTIPNSSSLFRNQFEMWDAGNFTALVSQIAFTNSFTGGVMSVLSSNGTNFFWR